MKEEYYLPDNYFFFPGNTHHKKNTKGTLAAFSQFSRQTLSDMKLVMIDYDKPELEKLLKEIGYTPCLLLLIPIGTILAFDEGVVEFGMYATLLWVQLLFYLAALTGWFLENRSTRIKVLFVSYYFFIMNLSVVLGFMRYAQKKQSVNWERAKRAS